MPSAWTIWRCFTESWATSWPLSRNGLACDSQPDRTQGRGIALADEGAPVERVGVLRLHCELCLAQRRGAALAGQQAAIEVLHQFPCRLVGDLPQAHDQRLGPGQDKCPPEAEDPLANVDLTQSSLTGREHNQFGGEEVQASDILGGQQSVISRFRQVAILEPGVGPGQRQAAAKQWVLRQWARQPARLSERVAAERLVAGLLLLVVEKEAVGGQVEDAGRVAVGLERAIESVVVVAPKRSTSRQQLR